MTHHSLQLVRQRLIAIVAGTSALLCVAAIALWVRSYWVADGFYYSKHGSSLLMQSGGGQFRFEYARATPYQWNPLADSGFSHDSDRADGPLRVGMRIPGSRELFDRWGFWIVTGERWGDDHYSLFLPAWFLSLALLGSPLYWFLAQRGRVARQLKLGLCPNCGYDLRATPDRCPECGASVGQERLTTDKHR